MPRSVERACSQSNLRLEGYGDTLNDYYEKIAERSQESFDEELVKSAGISRVRYFD